MAYGGQNSELDSSQPLGTVRGKKHASPIMKEITLGLKVPCLVPCVVTSTAWHPMESFAMWVKYCQSRMVQFPFPSGYMH